MAAQKGREILIKMGDGATPTEVFTTIAGLRTKSLTLGEETVDITNSDSAGRWRELLAGAGTKTVSVSGNGVFKDSASEIALITHMITGSTHKNFELLIPDFGTFAGAFAVTSSELGGEHNGEVTHSFALESAGVITFTAAA